MAKVHFVSNSYNGEVLEDLLTYTAQGNDTYDKGLIHIEAGIQMKKTLPHIQLGKIVQDRKPTPTSNDSQGQYKITERWLEPQDFMIYLEFNPRDYEQYWRPFQPTGPLVFRELDPRVQAKMLRLLIQGKNEYVGSAIWCGAKGGKAEAKITAPAGCQEIGGEHEYGTMKYFDGAIKRIIANATIDGSTPDKYNALSELEKNEVDGGQVKIVGSTELSTGEAVEAAFKALWKELPAKLRSNPNLRFVTSYDVWTLYDEYLSSKSSKYTDNTVENKLAFKGKAIVPVVGVPEHTIVLGVFNRELNSNLWMGVDYSQDYEAIKVEPLQNNSELYFFKMNLKMDVNIVKPKEILVWTAYKKSE